MLPCRLVLAPCFAGVAQLVEHHLAKVDVESSSLFARSILQKALGVDARGLFCAQVEVVGEQGPWPARTEGDAQMT